ncbi:serine hydrolase domain-containing protein [Deinococcus roseus]|uniref:Serine hydrolase n=1 Tax=Deinococcus roseus TaxID=392414 RepID=A0ABQ2CZB2_9DEIO|nr:serine hydrolase domain-containing protein [Deinococcus roseus]GGJ35677.1 serine hydrolase [Deinococcus roseus]
MKTILQNTLKTTLQNTLKTTLQNTLKKTLVLSLPLLLGSAPAQSSDLQDRLSPLVDRFHDTLGFMGTIIINEKGKTVFEKSVGMADLEHAIPNTADTVHRVASVTKSFTAVAVLKLQEEGKLKVTDPVSKYLPDYPNGDNITLHQLLTHTSGIFNYTERADLTTLIHERPTLEQLTQKFASEPVDFAPGGPYHYSNSGYILLGRVIEVASGMRYQDYLQQKVLAPLGFQKSNFFPDDAQVPNRAEGYTQAGDTFQKADLFNFEVVHAAGGFSATARELVQWLPGLAEGKVLSKASLQTMFTPHVYAPGGSYGYGLVVSRIMGKEYLNHAGSLPGGSSYIAYFPQEQISVVMLSNVTGQDSQALFNRLFLAYNRPQ